MSKVLPVATQDRPELNLRQGIKSSLSNWRQLLATLYLFQLYGGTSFCKEVQSAGKMQLEVDDQFAAWLNANWGSITNVVALVKQSSLYSAQMEHLQVGLELFLKLAKVDFVDANLADAAERTGGNRFAKQLRFSTNMKLLVDAISAYPESDRTIFVAQWLSGADDAVVSGRVKEVLAPFTEECQYKIRTSSGEIFFQEDGVYDGLRNAGDTVESSDAHEPVGPFRILKSYVKEGMHPYITDSSNGFAVKAQQTVFTNYADMVRTTLELIPKRTTIYQEVAAPATPTPPPPPSTASSYSKSDFLSEVFIEPTEYDRLVALIELKKNLVLQGAPGVGKTFAAKRLAWSLLGSCDDSHINFVQFHQSYCYEDFVIGFRPTATGFAVAKGVFFNACKQALASPNEKFYVIIDEINRGNLSRIFGELLMLIESDKRGTVSCHKYSVRLPNADSLDDAIDRDYASAFFVPENLYIIGMMNTADRSLAMIDYALRRRFSFYEMKPAFDAAGFQAIKPDANTVPVANYAALITKVKDLNDVLIKEFGTGFCIGHSYFCKAGLTKLQLENIVNFEIYPMLQEYWFDDTTTPKRKYDTWKDAMLNVL